MEQNVPLVTTNLFPAQTEPVVQAKKETTVVQKVEKEKPKKKLPKKNKQWSHLKKMLMVGIGIALIMVITAMIVFVIMICSSRTRVLGNILHERKTKKQQVPNLCIEDDHTKKNIDDEETTQDEQSSVEEIIYLNYGKSYSFPTLESAERACLDLGLRLANEDDIRYFEDKKLSWCGYGWFGDGQQGYVIQPDTSFLCEKQSGFIKKDSDELLPFAGAICYGVKPLRKVPGMYPYNEHQWSIDKKVSFIQ